MWPAERGHPEDEAEGPTQAEDKNRPDPMHPGVTDPTPCGPNPEL